MASRKEQKEQARAARIAKEREAAAKAQRTRRMQIFGGAIAIAVIVIVVVIVVSSGGKHGSPLLKPGRAERELVASVSSQLSNIPQNGTTLGHPDAKVTMTYFGDLECPICQAFTLAVFPQFVQDQVRTGNVKVTYRSSCTATCDDYSNGQSIFKEQQAAAYAAGKQNKFWDYAELFYNQQGAEGSGYVDSQFLNGIAKQVPGLDMAKWQSDRKDSALVAQVDSDQQLANQEAKAVRQKGTSTPTLVLDGPKGIEIASGTDDIDGTLFDFPSVSELEAEVKTVS